MSDRLYAYRFDDGRYFPNLTIEEADKYDKQEKKEKNVAKTMNDLEQMANSGNYSLEGAMALASKNQVADDPNVSAYIKNMADDMINKNTDAQFGINRQNMGFTLSGGQGQSPSVQSAPTANTLSSWSSGSPNFNEPTLTEDNQAIADSIQLDRNAAPWRSQNSSSPAAGNTVLSALNGNQPTIAPPVQEQPQNEFISRLNPEMQQLIKRSGLSEAEVEMPVREYLAGMGGKKFYSDIAGLVKAKTQMLNEIEKANLRGGGSKTPFNTFGQRVAFDTPENRQATLDKLNKLRGYLDLDETQVQTITNDINTGLAWDKTKQLDALVAKKLGLNYDVQQEYDLMDSRVKTNNAKITGAEQTEQQILTGTTIPGYKPIQGVRITNDSVKKVKDAAPIIENINKITSDILLKFDKKGYKFTGDDAAEYMANVRYLQMLAKSDAVFNLGVITGPDLMLLEQIIPNPASLKEGLKSNFLGSAKTRLTEFRRNMNNGALSQFRINGFEPDINSKKTSSGNSGQNNDVGNNLSDRLGIR